MPARKERERKRREQVFVLAGFLLFPLFYPGPQPMDWQTHIQGGVLPLLVTPLGKGLHIPRSELY
jgi:hypothetical protein